MTESAGPLTGLRVLDLSRLLPGPFCTLLLADMGAEVVRLEDPDQPDFLRGMPPFDQNGVGAAFAALHRNKKSLALRLRSVEGAAALKRIVSRFDVLVESFRPGVMESLGLGSRSLLAQNPRLLYCSITGYGQEGPNARRAGHDINYLALSGMAATTGTRGGEPAVPGFQMADLACGSLMAAMAILAALHQREATGEGQHIDVSMVDGAMALMPLQSSHYFATGEVPRPGRDLLNGGMPFYRFYRCADGRYLSVGALEPKFWRNLGEALQVEDATHERLEALFATRPRDEWTRLLAGTDCCVEPVLDFSEAVATTQAVARSLIWAVPGGSRQMAFPVKFSSAPGRPTPAPQPGEHTQALLEEAGLSSAEITAVSG